MQLRKRLALDLRLDVSLLECPIEFDGTPKECHKFATSNGYHFRRVKKLLFGGYYANDHGDCLYPT